MKYLLLVLIIIGGNIGAVAQEATLYGKVTDRNSGDVLEGVNVFTSDRKRVTQTDEKGRYELVIPANQDIIVEFTYINYQASPQRVRLKAKERQKLDVILEVVAGEIIVVEGERPDEMVSEGVKQLELIPLASGNLESALPTLFMGVRSSNELSSQYAVRGGNYDENLVYVNDFEIYRPFLIRSGQQEGLTFPNIDLIRDLSFSSGGFQTKYGDKMSSVLDIKYKIPDSTRASIGLSLLGGSAHVEGSLGKKSDSTHTQKLRYLLGARFKSSAYLLGSLDVTGEYVTDFSDLQGMLTYDLSKDWQLSWIGNYSKSVYHFVPEELVSTLGLINFALQFRVAFEGQEIDDFETYMQGVSLIHYPKDENYFLKFLASTYQSNENERFDLIGHYLLGQIETDLGSDDFGEIVGILGVGTEQNFARNFLTANVTNVAHRGGWEVKKEANDEIENHFFQWGVKYQREEIVDRLKEWERLDSAGYSIPYSTDSVLISEYVNSNINLQSNRLSAFFQDTWSISDSTKDFSLTAGIRASYWDLNKETTITPRLQMLYKPLNWKKDISFRFSTGLYFQPPFYRELRNLQGAINPNVMAQKSFHVVAGGTWDFPINGKPFRLIGEAYYKYLWDLVAYDIDNVRLRYYGDNNATGYAAGLDLRLNGEFVPGAESWINVSFLRTRESLTGIQHLAREAGNPNDTLLINDVPRPTDQFLAVSMFFQDYLPQNKNFKMHLNMTASTGVPFGLPRDNEVYRNTYRFNPYYRADIGFSALLWDSYKNDRWASSHPFRYFRKVWVSLEVLNLLGIRNTASNSWIKTIFSQQFAIPNYLTSRRLNLRLKVDF